MANIFSSGPTKSSHFLIFFLLSSPCSLYEFPLLLHTQQKYIFLSPFWSVCLLVSTVFPFPSSKQTLLKGVFNESFLNKNGLQTRWDKRALFFVPKLKGKKRRENDTKLPNKTSYFHWNKNRKLYKIYSHLANFLFMSSWVVTGIFPKCFKCSNTTSSHLLMHTSYIII